MALKEESVLIKTLQATIACTENSTSCSGPLRLVRVAMGMRNGLRDASSNLIEQVVKK